MPSNKWHELFFSIADVAATKSKDPSSGVGCVLVDRLNRVVSLGYNGFPRGANDSPELYNDRARKLRRVVHAEANAIVTAAAKGISVEGSTAYVTKPPCSYCAGLLINAGVSKVNFRIPSDDFMDRWREDITESLSLFSESGIFVMGYPSNGFWKYSMFLAWKEKFLGNG